MAPKKAPQQERKAATQEARQAIQSGNFGQSNVQQLRDLGVNSNIIGKIREQARQAPAAQSQAQQSQGVNIGYGVTNTGSPGGYSMPGYTDPRTGQPVPASQASNVFTLNIPDSIRNSGAIDMFGNPMNGNGGFQVVGDGVNWQDPANAGLLAQYYSPEAINKMLNDRWGQSSLNPNRDANMAAFMDSGHWESLRTGKPPTALPPNFTGLYNPANTGLSTPWSQQYAAANSGDTGAGGTGGTGGTGGGTPREAKNLGQALRIAAATGPIDNFITNREASKAYKDYGRGMDVNKFVNKIDAINTKGKERGLAPIGLSANLMNKLSSGKYGGMPYGNAFSGESTGDFSRILRGMRDSSYYQNPQSGTGTTTKGTGKFKKGTSVYGYLNDSDQILTGPGSGRPYSKTKWNMGGTAKPATPTGVTPTVASNTGAGATDTGSAFDGGIGDAGMTPEQMKEASTVGSGFGGFGADVASWATGFKPKRSSRKAGPRGAQNLSGATRISPTYNTLGL